MGLKNRRRLFYCPICKDTVPMRREDFPLHCACGMTYTGFRFNLGQFVARLLKAVGVTPRRVQQVIRRPCHCKQREEALDKAGDTMIAVATVWWSRVQYAAAWLTGR